MLVNSDVDVSTTAKLIFEGKQGYETHARGPISIVSRSILDMDAKSDQTYLRRNDMDKLV